MTGATLFSSAVVHAIFNSTGDAVIQKTLDGVVTDWSRGAEIIFGYTRDEMIGQPVHRLLPSDWLAEEARMMALVCDGEDVEPFDSVRVQKDGSRIHVSVSISPIRDDLGAITGVATIARDITARKVLEETLDATRAQMASGARLSALGEMAGAIAHEINNPLAVIHALASDLVEQCGERPEEILAYGERIVEYCERIAKIVRSLRHIARDGDGDGDPFEQASVSEVVGRTLDLCKDRFHHHSIDLLTSPIDPGIQILCREVQISQALVNLLQNALDAVQDQGGEKWVRLEVATESHHAVISVMDSGKGVPPELKERIMDPFFTTKAVGKGTGLGLSLSTQIAQAHGGTLQLTEWCGHTCFSLRLPIFHHGRIGCK